MRTLTAVYQSNIGGHQHLRARSERINAARLFIILTSYTQVYEDSGVFFFKTMLSFLCQYLFYSRKYTSKIKNVAYSICSQLMKSSFVNINLTFLFEILPH